MGQTAHTGDKENIYWVLVWKVQDHLENLNIIKMDLKETG